MNKYKEIEILYNNPNLKFHCNYSDSISTEKIIFKPKDLENREKKI